jgi:hypothetical protein
MRIVQRWRWIVTVVMILNHLVWRGHWWMSRRIGIHGDRLIPRKTVGEMAGSPIEALGDSVRHRRCSSHDDVSR